MILFCKQEVIYQKANGKYVVKTTIDEKMNW